MPEQITEIPTPIPTVPLVPVETKNKSGLPVIAILLIVILLITGGVYAGIQIEKRKVKVWTEPPLTEVIPKPTNNTPQIVTETIAEKPTGGVDETTNWKTYKDDNLGFMINYSIDWEVSVSNNSYTPYLYIKNPYDQTSIGGLVLSYFKEASKSPISGEYFPDPNMTTYDKVLLSSGVNAYSKLNQPGDDGTIYDEYFIITPKQEYFRIVSSKENTADNKKLSSDQVQIQNKILSTFKFTNQ